MKLEIINYAAYEKIIMEKLYIGWMLSGFLILIGAGFLIYTLYSMLVKKERTAIGYIAGIVGAFIIVLCVALDITYYQKSKYDIDNRAYVIYNGNFTVEEFKDVGSVPLHIPDENGITLEYDASLLDVDGGVYKGRIVYGEKTKVLLEIDIEEQIE